MAAYRGRTIVVGLRVAAACFRISSKVVCQRMASLPTFVRKNWVSLSATGLCAIPIAQETLSHEALIKRASSLVTDSTNTYLSQTTLALVDILTKYTKAMHTLIALQKRYMASVSKLTQDEEEVVWQVILKLRQEVIGLREECKHFESNWKTAINLSELAAEAAFNAGADQASVTARTSLQVAEAHVEHTRTLSLEAEEELKACNAEDGERIQPTLTEAAEEEEEIPEAYLRED